jgi:hypothetical protein
VADLLYLAKIGGARGAQNVDLTTLTPVLLSVKLGGSVSNTELTQAILDNLINLQNGTDFTSGTNSHTHDGRYYTISRLVNNASGSAGSNLIGDDSNYTNFTSSSLTIKSTLSGIDAALSALTNANISPSAAIAYSKLANLGGSTGAVLIQNASGFVAPSAIIYTNLLLADGTVPLTGNLSANSNKITNLAAGSSASDAVNYGQVILTNGANAFTANQSMGGNKLTNVANGTFANDAVNFGQLQAVANGNIWLDPVQDPDLVNDSLSTPPVSPVSNTVYLIGPAPTGAWASIGAGHVVWYNFSTLTWVDLLGRAVQIGDRFGVTLEHGNGSEGGNMVGNHNNILQVTNATPGSYAYSIHVPVLYDSVFVNNPNSQHFSHSYNYNGTSWVEIAGPGVITPGAALAFAGNTLNVLVDSLTINTNGSNQLQVIDNSITNTKLAFMANNTVKGNKSGSSAAPSDLALGNLTETVSSILTITGGSFATVGNVSIQVALATGSTSGYLSASDWTNFNSAYIATTAATSLATPSTIMKRDGSANVQINNIAKNLAAVVTGGGTTTLTAGSAAIQQFIGSSSQTVILPDATTLSIGFSFTILNRSTVGSITVNANGGSTLATLTPGTQAVFVATNIGTSAGVWDIEIIASYVAVYDQRITVVSGTPVGNQITGPVSPGTNVTLPSAETYNSSELKIYLNGQKLKATVDWNTVGSLPRTQVTFTDTLQVGDKIDFVIERQY